MDFVFVPQAPTPFKGGVWGGTADEAVELVFYPSPRPLVPWDADARRASSAGPITLLRAL